MNVIIEINKMHSQSINKLVNRAMEVAMKSTFQSYKHGAVLFSCHNDIIGSGYNQHGTTKLFNFCVPSLHAEADCLRTLIRGFRKKYFKEFCECF